MRLLLLLLGACVPEKGAPRTDTDGTSSEPRPESESGESGDTADCDPCIEQVWYADEDGDGFGDPAVSTVACEADPSQVEDDSDCDDTNAERYPGAPEICMDGVYNDCLDVDGSEANAVCSSESPLDIRTSDAKLLGVEKEDYVGRGVAAAGDLNGDGREDLLVSSLQVVQTAINGTVYVVFGAISGSRSLAEADASLYVYDLGSRFYRPAHAAIGDQNEDGYPELMVGAPREDLDGDYDVGVAYLLNGPVVGELSTDDADAWVVGLDGIEEFGATVEAPGDVDGDGQEDLLIGGPAIDTDNESDLGACVGTDADEESGDTHGGVVLFLRPLSGEYKRTDADVQLFGEDAGDNAGSTLAHVGDLDGDGLADLFVGAYGQCYTGSGAGAAYVLTSPEPGTLNLADADLKLPGEWGGDRAGYSLSGAGDVNGDGTPDLLIGSPNWPAGELWGRAYLHLGYAPGLRGIADGEANIFGAEGENLNLGRTLAGVGDVDADGFDDFVIGDPYNSENGHAYGEEGYVRGAVYLIYGPMSGSLQPSDADKMIVGSETGMAVGYSISAAGDMDKDGLADILIGAPGDCEAADGAGAAHLLLGSGPILTGTVTP